MRHCHTLGAALLHLVLHLSHDLFFSQLFRLFLNHSPRPLDNLKMSRPKQIHGVVYNVGKVTTCLGYKYIWCINPTKTESHRWNNICIYIFILLCATLPHPKCGTTVGTDESQPMNLYFDSIHSSN